MRLDCYGFALGMGVPPCDWRILLFSQGPKKVGKQPYYLAFGSINSFNA